mmetsp:Transcript_20387/g.36579  ORF Transcript_20387/g.36579 Transcript_20387/m.36579 type:complete len:109 (+) Transcript_20387:251-577(+)
MSDHFFSCEECGFRAPYLVFDRTLDEKESEDSSKILFLDRGYLCLDPNSINRRPLLLGGHCAICKKRICAAPSCSIFYAKLLCLPCCRTHASELPPEIVKLASGPTAV